MKNEYPKLMEVSDYADFRDKIIRVVFMQKNGKYIAWKSAETFEEAEKEIDSFIWEYARDIDPFRELKEAYSQGKIIQVNMHSQWEDITGEPIWNGDVKYLRIKPEYVPFDYSDAEFLIGKMVKLKNSVVGIITAVYCDESVIVGNVPYTFKELFNDFTFFDGSVCGKTLI